MRLVERLFRGNKKAASELEAVVKSLEIPHERIGWDWYDQSIELYGIPSDFRLTEAQAERIFQCGFAVIYVNHLDKWETHYRAWGQSKPWRVSYPHKRGPEEVGILVEEPCSWPKEWFETGAARVVTAK